MFVDQVSANELRQTIAELLNRPQAGTYREAVEQLGGLQHVTQEYVAAMLTEPLNREMRARPHESLGEKQSLARWVNAELRELAIAIRCPKTGNPAILRVGPGDDAKVGRFQLELVGGKERARKRTISSKQLMDVQLRPAEFRREPLADYWANRTQQQNELER